MPIFKSLLARLSGRSRSKRLLEEIEIELLDLAGRGNEALQDARDLSARLSRDAEDLGRRAEGIRRRIRVCLAGDREDLALMFAETLDDLKGAVRRTGQYKEDGGKLCRRLAEIRQRRIDLARVRAERALASLGGELEAAWRARLAAAFERADIAVKEGDAEPVRLDGMRRQESEDEDLSLSGILRERQALTNRAEKLLASLEADETKVPPEGRP